MRISLLFFSLFLGLGHCEVISQTYITNGDALNQGNCYRLTADQGWQSGSVWYLDKINLEEDFDLYFDIFLGCKDNTGADGIAFVLQPISTSIGSVGGGLGYEGVDPSVAIEIDTWQNGELNDPWYDHVAVQIDGNVSHGIAGGTAVGPVSALPGFGNIEDCNWHKFRVRWNADSMRLQAYIDCNLVISYVNDLTTNYFNNDPLVFWGFTGSTGGSWNEQQFCLDYISFTESQRDTAICQGQSVTMSVGSGSTFQWSPATWLSDPTAMNPVASPDTTTTYTVIVQDACGQTRFDTVTVFVQTDTVLDVLPDQIFLCQPGQVTNLSASYLPFTSYLWSNGDTTRFTTATQPGNYQVTMTNFCRTFSDAVQILPATPPTLSSQNATCHGANNGSATLTAAGLGPFQYTWRSLNTGTVIQSQTSASPVSTVSNLPAGVYLSIVQNASGCRDTVPFQITAPPVLTLQVTAAQNLICFNNNGGSITVAATGGTGAKLYRLGNGGLQANPTFGGLSVGSYTITAVDQNGCEASTSVTLTQPPPVVLTPSVVQGVDCFGAATGSVTVAASQGVAPYEYRINAGPYQAAPTFANLTAGNYTVITRDNNGCLRQITVTISEPSPLTGSAQVNQVDCFGDLSGVVTLSASGGAPAYAFSFQGGAFSTQTSFTGLGAGSYSIEVRDDSGCVTPFMATVLQPLALGIQAELVDAACFGESSGYAVVQGVGGWGDYQFSISGQPFLTQDTLSGLSAGTYQVSVMDDSACTFTQAITIGQPDLLELVVTERVDVDCLGNNTGVLSVAATGGTAPYQYGRNGLPLQPAPTFTELFAGIYQLRVQDLQGCEANVDTFLTTPTGLSGGVDVLTNVACFGDSSGSITLTAFGGAAPYRYALNGDTIISNISNLFGNLPTMTDTLMLIDDNGCLVPIPFTISEPPLLQLALASQKDLACFQIPDGEISLTAIGGTTPYSYTLGTVFQPGALFEDLAADSYLAIVQDALGCLDSLSVALQEPPQLILDTVLLRHVRCFGEENGSIEVMASGGSGSYEFRQDTATWGTGLLFAGLSGGSYWIQVRDDSLCLDSLVFQIIEPDRLVNSVDQTRNIACAGGNTGEILLLATGGRDPLQYQINGGDFQPDPLFLGLTAGSYLALVQDDSLCTDTVSVELTEPDPLNINLVSMTDVRCFGEGNGEIVVTATGGVEPYSFSLNTGGFLSDTSFSSLEPGAYQVIVRDDSACESALSDLQINEPALLTAFAQMEEVRCFEENTGTAWVTISGGNVPYSTEWWTDPIQFGDTARSLVAGNYGYRVEDSLGCEVMGEVVVTQPDRLMLALDSLREAFCDFENGAAWLSASGGTPGAGYVFDWSGLPLLLSGAAVDVPGQAYEVFLRDSRGCLDSILFEIPNTPPADTRFTTIPDPALPILESTGDIQFSNLTTGAVAYLWEFGDGSMSDVSNPSHAYDQPGDYRVTLTGWNEFFVCPTTFSLTLTIIADGQLYFPNAFTPNADGNNDVFYIKGEGISDFEAMIYDRWGRHIITLSDLSQGWDGRIPGAGIAQEGVYVFVVRARTNAGANIEHSGTVTLIK